MPGHAAHGLPNRSNGSRTKDPVHQSLASFGGNPPFDAFGVEPFKVTRDASTGGPDPYDGIAFHGYLAEKPKGARHEPEFGYGDVAADRPARCLGQGLHAEAVVALIKDQFVVLVTDAETGIEQCGAEGAHR